jgi:hypothetical protein
MGDLGGPERTSEVRLLGGRAKRLQVGLLRGELRLSTPLIKGAALFVSDLAGM